MIMSKTRISKENNLSTDLWMILQYSQYFTLPINKTSYYIYWTVKSSSIFQTHPGIIVLENREIAGVGSHENLVEKCEIYKEMYLEEIKERNSNNQTPFNLDKKSIGVYNYISK